MIDCIDYILECNFNSLFVLLLLIRLVICQCLCVIFTRTGNSFEVKIEADSSDVTDYVQDDKPRTNIGTKRSLKDRKAMHHKLPIHRRSHSGQKTFECTVCSKRFTTSFNLVVHSIRHTGEHLYSCSQCEKSFSYPSALSQHKNIQVHRMWQMLWEQ